MLTMQIIGCIITTMSAILPETLILGIDKIITKFAAYLYKHGGKTK